MKTLGIIGGMGPEATNHLTLKIIKGFEDGGEVVRPNIVVNFVPVGIVTESNLIINNDRGNFTELLINSAKSLERSGVDFIIIACNSVHLFIEEVRKTVSIPVISVIEEVESLNLQCVGIIATDFTIKNKLFENKTVLIKPDDVTQISINNIIDCLVKGIKPSRRDLVTTGLLFDAWVQKGVNTCILGCSEMQLLTKFWNRWSKRITFVDTMDVLAKAAVNNLLN